MVAEQHEHQRGAVARARAAVSDLVARGVVGVALTFVDNVGVTRVKTVPVDRLEHAVEWGVGMSPVFEVFLSDDSFTTSTYVGGPDGDLRLVPDLEALTSLAAQPGWAWAPVDRFEQDGQAYRACQRTFARRMTQVAAEAGLALSMAFEIEWALGRESEGRFVPAVTGPAYGMSRLVELSDYGADLLRCLQAEGVSVEQFHPEYAAGQLEVSVAPDAPVGAADRNVLVRQTVRAVSRRHGWQASFSPSVVAGAVGNGAHVHCSLWRERRNLLAGGTGRYGMTEEGEAFIAGILAELPALS
ncbi:MAG TPA: hypothetical protein VE152_06760, partial [Acidimicrobiales bacterium]|nr:hypothetical protein [Acidimicrobiales bacterium]